MYCFIDVLYPCLSPSFLSLHPFANEDIEGQLCFILAGFVCHDYSIFLSVDPPTAFNPCGICGRTFHPDVLVRCTKHNGITSNFMKFQIKRHCVAARIQWGLSIYS